MNEGGPGGVRKGIPPVVIYSDGIHCVLAILLLLPLADARLIEQQAGPKTEAPSAIVG